MPIVAKWLDDLCRDDQRWKRRLSDNSKEALWCFWGFPCSFLLIEGASRWFKVLSVSQIAQVGQKRVVKILMFPPHKREERLCPLSKGRDKFLVRRSWTAAATSLPRGLTHRRRAGAPHPPPLTPPPSTPYIQLLLLERLVLCDNWIAVHRWLSGSP